MDHIFPVARGGLTVRSNLVPTHWRVNNVKRDQIVNGLSDATLCQGLTVEHFKHLARTYQELSANGARGSRQEQNHMLSLLLKGDMRGRLTPAAGPQLWENLKRMYRDDELLVLWQTDKHGV
jgi:hypothetical protein